jgi:hypothetical protein
MKKPKMKKAFLMISVTVLLLAAYLIYSRPLTIQQRYPMLDLEQCTDLRGYYEIGGQGRIEFTVDKNSEDFETLCTLLYEQAYRRSLKDLLPHGTRTYRVLPEDFEWEVFFQFEDVAFPDGSHTSGRILRVDYWYGELDIHFYGDIVSCSTKQQESWAKTVLDIIQ